jgi:hypothetical protein
MSTYTFGTRRLPAAALAALDRGLLVRLDTAPQQAAIFSGAENLSLDQLTSELACMLSELRVRSFRYRADIEAVTTAMMRNVRYGFYIYARRAALDLAGILNMAAEQRLADRELCQRGLNAALRVAELCAVEACSGENVPEVF